MIRINFLMNEIKIKIYYSNVRMYKKYHASIIQHINNAKNDTDDIIIWNTKQFFVACLVLLQLMSRSIKQ